MSKHKIAILFLVNIFLNSCTNSTEKNEYTERASGSDSVSVISFGNQKSNKVGKEKLSEYGFFKGELADLSPENDVYPYSLNSALFSDYALKARFVKFPEVEAANYHSTEVLEFPVGTVLIKNFYYPEDFNQPDGKRNILETRLLIQEEEGWKALPYIWNDEQTEAFLEVAGGAKSVSWRDAIGQTQKIMYSIPNMNQCRSCHLLDDKIMPIGSTARQLNGDYEYAEHGVHNQLKFWQTEGKLKDLPVSDLPKLANYENEAISIPERARAYLEINCGHCHRPEGPAKNSALNLMASVSNPATLGVGKTPIAAGKGSGGLKYDIVPGHPDQSILVYRMQSEDPGIMMPELGRKMVHVEGLELVKQWIAEMEK